MEDNNIATLTSDTTTGDTTEDNTIEYSDIVEDDVGDGLAEAYENKVVLVKDGQLVSGKVVKINPYEVLVDIGYKSEGVIPQKELAIRQDVDPGSLVSVGEEIEALVLQKEDREGRLVLSKKRASYEKAWSRIEELKKANELIKGVVIEVVNGGLIVDIGIRGFLPASLVELRRVTKLDDFLGQEIEAKILEFDKQRRNVVLSRRAWLEETQREKREALMENLMPGDVQEGVVTSIVDFGVFVDLGLMDGLVHVSELSWKRIEHPSEVVSVGDKIKVRVLGVDSELERIALSLRATQQGPWVEFAETHKVGDLVYGRVTKLVAFGAFIQVGDDVDGLVHITEMAHHRVESPGEVVSPGEELWVKIVEIDVSRRRIGLSIRQAMEGGEVAVEYQSAFGNSTEAEDGDKSDSEGIDIENSEDIKNIEDLEGSKNIDTKEYTENEHTEKEYTEKEYIEDNAEKDMGEENPEVVNFEAPTLSPDEEVKEATSIETSAENNSEVGEESETTEETADESEISANSAEEENN